jgi:DNA-directed RNA polymerase specialized sigma24 family protein
MTTAVAGPRPKESLFYAPVVYLIGKLSGFKAYVGVDHRLIQDDAMRLAGIDPEDCPWPLKSTSSKKRDGLYRVVHFGWYHQTRQYREENEALCAKPLDPESKGKRGFWALTELGVKRAKALREIYEGQIVLSAGPNATAQFLAENWERYYDRMTLALRRKMPKSAELDKVDDHAMNWIEKIIQRDGLRKYIRDGRSIAPSQVSGWARKLACTQIRNEGRNPVCRVFHGALTPKEYKALGEGNWTEEVIPRTINESDILCHNQYAAHSESDWIEDSTEAIQDTHMTAQVEDAVANADAMEHVIDRISGVLMAEISDEFDPDFHRELMVDRFVRQLTVREIAEKHGLNFGTEENRIKVALSRVRDVMLQARDEGTFDEFLTR